MKIKNKILMMAFTLVTFLSFEVINVNAATIDIASTTDYSDNRIINTATTLKLTNDISLEGIPSSTHYDSIHVNADLTIDLNGHTLTMPDQSIKLWYYSNHTVTITDSSSDKTGLIIRQGDEAGILLSNINPATEVNLIIDGIKYKNASTSTHGIEIVDDVTNGGAANIIIKNSTFEIYHTLYQGYSVYVHPSTLSLEIENSIVKTTDSSRNVLVLDTVDFQFKDIIDTTNSLVYGDDTLLSDTQVVNSTGYNKVEIKNKYNLTTSVNGGIGGTISATKTAIVEGTEETVTFTPATGYRIAKVLVNTVETTVSGNSLELTMDKSYTVEVYYERIPFTLTVEENSNATINLNGSETVYHGDTRNITITANHGYELISVKVNNVEKIDDMSFDTLILSSITENKTIEVEVAQITYNVVEGKNQNLDLKNKITSFVVKADGEYIGFSELLIDGTLVNGTLYDVTEGSTIITFNADGLNFLKDLPKGNHTLTFVYEDGGTATTNFTISDSTGANNPQTGDNITMSIVLGLISLVGLTGVTIYTKKGFN